MSHRPRTEWVHRERFAEIAEALGISTASILGAVHEKSRWTVMWTADDLADETDLDQPVKVGVLERDPDGVLRLVGLPRDAGSVRDFLPPHDEFRSHDRAP